MTDLQHEHHLNEIRVSRRWWDVYVVGHSEEEQVREHEHEGDEVRLPGKEGINLIK